MDAWRVHACEFKYVTYGLVLYFLMHYWDQESTLICCGSWFQECKHCDQVSGVEVRSSPQWTLQHLSIISLVQCIQLVTLPRSSINCLSISGLSMGKYSMNVLIFAFIYGIFVYSVYLIKEVYAVMLLLK